MKILVINCGSSSIKYKLFQLDGDRVPSVIAEGIVERIGATQGSVTHVAFPGGTNRHMICRNTLVADHGQGLEIVVELLNESSCPVIADRDDIQAVGHRVVHGGEFFHAPTRIDADVLAKIDAVASLAPLHNPVSLEGIRVALDLFPHTPQVAIFDTAFHQTMPACAFRYALPRDYYIRCGLRRYGFHGTSHQYVTRQACRLLSKPVEQVNLISLHLGSGASMCAVRGGCSVDTTMGLTPLAGLAMGTRCGDIDPGLIIHMMTAYGLSPDELDRMLNKESGLIGICGFNDMRDIHRRRQEGDSDAQLAFEMFTYRIKHYIGAYAAILGRLDALVFTGGIGENDSEVRAKSCADLELLGIRIDTRRNVVDSNQPRHIHAPDSKVAVLVVPTDEEIEIARQTADAVC
jgi:acetate kinase